MAESSLNRAASRAGKWRPAGVPVLLYHGISPAGTPPVAGREGKFWVTYTRFDAHLDRMRRDGYRLTPLPELWWLSDPAVKAPLLAVTFDDGHETDYSVAYPLLQKYGFRADFFINTSTVGSAGYLTWGQIGEMHRGGMSFQSHSHNHTDLSHLPLRTLRHQLRHSKELIEDRLGHPVEFLSVPYGLTNQQVLEAAIDEGYRAVCTSRNWPARLGEAQISRTCIHADTGRHEFEGLLARDLSPYAARRAREALLYIPKQILLRLNPTRLTVQVLGGQE